MENNLDKHWRWRHVGVEMAMKLVAVDRAAGQCEAFKGDFDDEYLPNLVERYYDYRSEPLFDAVFICIYCKLAN